VPAVDPIGSRYVKKFAIIAMTLLLASCAAAMVAYSAAHVAHYSLGIPSAALRGQALISAVLVLGLVTIEFLVTRGR